MTRCAVPFAAVLLIAATSVAIAQTPPEPPAAQVAPPVAEPSAGTTNDISRLRSRLEERWRIVPMRQGFVLVPRQNHTTVKGIEVSGAGIGVDGRDVTGAELRALLGADAEAVLQLSYLDEAGRNALADPAPAPREPAPVVEPPRESRPSWSERRRGRNVRLRLGRDLTVPAGERVRNAVAVLGSVRVDGQVDEDVVAVLGNVTLGPTAVVGDVTAVGGTVTADPAAVIKGDTNEVAVTMPPVDGGWWRFPGIDRWDGSGRRWLAGAALGLTVTRMIVLGLVLTILVAVGRRRVAELSARVAAQPFVATAIGFGGQILFVVLFGALAITLIISILGIPLLGVLPIVALLIGLAWLSGFAAIAVWVGQGFGAADDRSEATFGQLWRGLAAIWLLTLAAAVAWVFGVDERFPVVFWTLRGAGIAVETLAWSAGFGVLVLALMSRWSARSPAAAVPPLSSDAPVQL